MLTQTPGSKHVKCPSCGNGVQFTANSDGVQVCPACNYHLPREIGHFKLLELLGTGGMGAVFRGLDTSLQREVAVKVMREELTKSEKFVADFLREARATAALNHPNIAKIYTCGEEAGRYFIVMELLSSGSLDDRINSGEKLDEVEVIDIGIQVASGLREAQKHGLIHRDIKPGNILFDEEKGTKLVDFGLARLEEQSEEHLREEGIWGTPYYIAPEKVARNQEDFRSDIYSLGGTLFHALAGRAPFEAETSNEVVEKHLQAASVSLQAFAPHVAPQTAYVIGRMMRREPAERPQSYDQLLDELYAAKEIALRRKAFQSAAGIKKEEVDEPMPWGAIASIILVVSACVISLVYLYVNRHKYFGTPLNSSSTSPVVETPVTAPPRASSSNPDVKPPDTASTSTPLPIKAPIAWQKPWQIAQDSLAAGKPSLAIAQMEAIAAQLPAEHPQQPWLSLQLGVAALFNNDSDKAKQYFSGAIEKAAVGSLDGPLGKEQLPPAFARAFLGQTEFGKMQKQLASSPDWAMALFHFYRGVQAERLKEFEIAFQEYKSYDGTKLPGDEPWVLTFKPMVKRYLEEYPKFAERFGKAQAALARDDPDAAQIHLSEIDHLEQPSLKAAVDELSQKTDDLLSIKNQEIATRAKADLEKKQKLADRMTADAVQKEQQMLKTYDFAGIYAMYRETKRLIPQEVSNRNLESRLRRAEKMADFRAALLKDLQTVPYTKDPLKTRANARLIGKIVSVDETHLEFRFDGGMMKATWGELAPESILTLGEFYLDKAVEQKDRQAIARRAFNLACVASALGQDKKSASYLATLQDADPALKTAADRIFSGIE